MIIFNSALPILMSQKKDYALLTVLVVRNREFKLPVSGVSSSPNCGTLRDVFLEVSMLQYYYSK